VITVAGSPGSSGETNGVGSTAQFSNPSGVAVDAAGDIYVADTGNDTVRRIAPDGTVSLLAGAPGLSGGNDGTRDIALFSQPCGVAVDGVGNIYVADTGNSTIRMVTPAGIVTTMAGVAGIAGFGDGAGSSALFNQPRGLVPDGAGGLYVVDTGNSAIRRISASGIVTTLPVVLSVTQQTPPPSTEGSTFTGGIPTAVPSTPTGATGGGAMSYGFIALLVLLGSAALARRH
jgi:streptogramin lyase